MRRSINSERDLRNFLNTGSLDVSGYTGELSYVSFIRRIWAGKTWRYDVPVSEIL